MLPLLIPGSPFSNFGNFAGKFWSSNGSKFTSHKLSPPSSESQPKNYKIETAGTQPRERF